MSAAVVMPWHGAGRARQAGVPDRGVSALQLHRPDRPARWPRGGAAAAHLAKHPDAPPAHSHPALGTGLLPAHPETQRGALLHRPHRHPRSPVQVGLPHRPRRVRAAGLQASPHYPQHGRADQRLPHQCRALRCLRAVAAQPRHGREPHHPRQPAEPGAEDAGVGPRRSAGYRQAGGLRRHQGAAARCQRVHGGLRTGCRRALLRLQPPGG